MDRVSSETQKMMEELRNAVEAARRTRETTERLLRRIAHERGETPQQPSEAAAAKLRLHRTGRW